MGATQQGFATLAIAGGHRVICGKRCAWLSNRGHLNPSWAGVVPTATVELLSSIHSQLGGDETLLHAKRSGSDPIPDFELPEHSLLIEIDEIQHFTTDRAGTLAIYPAQSALAFDPVEYERLALAWSRVGDRYRASKPCADFPFAGGRRAQRAYFDAVRDLAAPYFGLRVLRIAVPECDPLLAMSRFDFAIQKLFDGSEQN